MGSTAYGAGQSFADLLGQAWPVARDATLNALIPGRPIIQAAAPTIHDFLSGAIGGAPPNASTVTVALPQAKLAPKPAPAAKVPAAPATQAKAAADQTAAFGNLSFRQLLALSQVAENTAPRGSAKPPSTTDAAGAALASIYQSQFTNSLKAAGNDAAKQQAAVDAYEKKMLPIALKGNTADEYIYGQN